MFFAVLYFFFFFFFNLRQSRQNFIKFICYTRLQISILICKFDITRNVSSATCRTNSYFLYRARGYVKQPKTITNKG